MSESAPVQRLRVLFGKGDEVKYVSHLAVMRAWERIVRRAGVPISYSQGFNPRPKLTFASALPVGATGRAEVLDLELREQMPPDEVLGRLRRDAPAGFQAHFVQEVPLRVPALQAVMRFSVYEARLALDLSEAEVRQGLDRLLSAEQVLRQREVKDRLREYNLRQLVNDLWYAGQADGLHVVGMILVTDNTAAGRPDEVLAELGWGEVVRSVDRVRLVFEDQVDELESVRSAVWPMPNMRFEVGGSV